MTPLAMKVFTDLSLPKARRRLDDRAGVLDLFGRDLHCFEVSAVGKVVEAEMDEVNLWDDAATMIPRAFLPSPVTWLEMMLPDHTRWAWVLDKGSKGFRLYLVRDDGADLYSLPMCEFWNGGVLSRSMIDFEFLVDEDDHDWAKGKWGDKGGVKLGSKLLEAAAPIDRKIEALEAQHRFRKAEIGLVETTIGKLSETQRLHAHGIVFSLLMLDLINTPGLVGLKHHDAHRGLARRLARNVGSYPLRGWSEIVLKHQTKLAEDPEYSIASCRKCLHFVRSHRRRYRDGRVIIIPAHWRGDPALGIRRTRYKLAPLDALENRL